MEEIYLAGGCLWGVQHFLSSLPGVIETEAGRANGMSQSLSGPYDGYAECVRTVFDPSVLSVEGLMGYFFEIIDPYSVNRQGQDVGEKYRTGVYSKNPRHLSEASRFIRARMAHDRVRVEVLPLFNYVRSAEEHQHHLARFPEDYYLCSIPLSVMNRYRKTKGSD
ncbi:MAG: peptide-methionine (S)-S-oxide reductase [Dialister sp.]|nr:peptide-methionine (S)-S-oxide reductase [Dialister sp.]